MKASLALRSFLLGSAILAATTTLHATPYYWNNADGSWADETKWSDNATSGGTTGVDPTSSDTVVFNQSSVNGAEIITLSGATSIGGITFNNTGTTAIRSDTSGTNRVLTIGAGGITMASGAGQSEIGIAGTAPQPTVSVTLGASQEWKNNSSATLFVRNGGSLGAHTLTLTTTGSGLLSFGGNVTGTGNIIVKTNSTVSMAGGGSTYSGTTTINSGGILIINALANFGTAGSLGVKSSDAASNLVIDGGTLRIQVSATDSNRLFTMGVGGATLEAINTGSNSGQIKLTNTGAIAYTGIGNRTLTIGGASDDTGGSAIALDIDDVGGGNGIVSLVKNGTHAWTVSGATNSYSGGTTVNAGTLTMGSASALGSTSGQLTVNTGGTLDMASNSLTVGNLTGTGGTISGTSGTRLLTIGQGNGTGGNFQGAINDGAGGTTALTKTGNGTITLSGANGYTGDTTVSAGVLAVNGSLANTTTTVTGGTLRGSGSIGGSVTIQDGGTLAAGNSIESLTTGALELEAGSTFAYELDDDSLAGAEGDLTAVTGNLTLDLTNMAVLTLSEIGTSGNWANGDKLTLLSYSGTWNGGLFRYLGSTLTDGATINFSGIDWEFDYNDTAAGTNYTGDLTGTRFVTMTAVPEPRAALLGGLGMLMLFRRRRN